MAKTKTIDPSEIPEVVAFEEAKLKLQRFREAYQDMFAMLEPLVEEYNDKLEAASKAVSARRVSCGDFSKISETVTYDADKLFELVGHDKFLTIGAIATKQVFTIDKKRVELAIQAGSIGPDVVDEVRKITPRYSKPKPVVLP